MNNAPKTIADLKDSRILYEKKLPAFGYMIISLVGALIIGVLIWSLVTHKVYIVKGSGVVESDNKNYIMSGYSGEISDIKIKNGDYVEEGDLLFSIKSTDLDLQQIQIRGKLETYEKQIFQLQKLEKAITDDKNYFDFNNAEDKPYYNQFEAYKAQVAQNVVDVAMYKQYGYTEGQIEAEIAKNEAKISEVYHSTLKTIGETITNATAELEGAKTQGEAISEGQAEYGVTASASGIVHMSSDYKTGMVVQAGASLGSIANENDAYTVKAYIGVNDMPRVNKGDGVDIAVVGLMESVYGVAAGSLVGIDSDVTTEQKGESKSNASYFRLDIKTDAGYLISKSGRKYNLSNGTAVEARIKYDEVTYFRYFLESLGVLVR